MLDHRLAGDRQQRFGLSEGQWIEARGVPGGKNNDFHLALEKAGAMLPGQFLAAGQDFGGRFALEGEFRQFPGFGQFEAADDELDGRHQRGGDAQFIHAQTEQKRHQHRVARHLPANADPDPMVVGGLDGGLDQAQNGRMGRLIKVGDFLVHPVHRQRVLDEVVGADAEELEALGQRIGDDRGRGGLDHGADFQVFVEGHALLAQFLLVFLDQGIGLIELVQAGDHGVHHLDVALGAGAEDGAELVAEDVRAAGGKTGWRASPGTGSSPRESGMCARNLSPPRSRVRMTTGSGLSAAATCAVGLVLLLLAGGTLAVDEEVFRAEQADAFGAVGLDLLGVGGLLDIGREDRRGVRPG